MRARARRRIRLRQIVSLIPDVLHQAPDQQAVRLAAKARHDGFEEIRRLNRAAWAELWKGRIRLVGAEDRWQAIADAAFFYLNTSVHSSSPASTSIFGLATWHDYHYYYGHVMWDIEAFAAPPLCLLQPDAAAALLAYRTEKLDGAKRNARLLGRRSGSPGPAISMGKRPAKR
jgi:protein-glucosylgalactosylhydroxylysine glucosidase